MTKKHYRVKNPGQNPTWLHEPQTGPTSAPGAPRPCPGRSCPARSVRPTARPRRAYPCACRPLLVRPTRCCRAPAVRPYLPRPLCTPTPAHRALPSPACRTPCAPSALPARPNAVSWPPSQPCRGRVCAQAWPYRGLPRDTVPSRPATLYCETPRCPIIQSNPTTPKSQYKECVTTHLGSSLVLIFCTKNLYLFFQF